LLHSQQDPLAGESALRWNINNLPQITAAIRNQKLCQGKSNRSEKLEEFFNTILIQLLFRPKYTKKENKSGGDL
jgi:hypothetical protein